jgi:UDP-N-acetylglucosamine--N-acetylmuramyl-(pentapeptide) pyrophosphoryl-undecaprenol N-acetylglucosamine transferase
MKLLIAAGGTGGHIYPGVAIANEVIARDAASEVLFVGTARGLEKKIVPENGYQLALINSAGLKNVGLVGKVRGMMVLPRSFWEARKILKEFKPDAVVGAGGYVSGPVLMTAHFMGYPTLLMDSNALPGFTNRRLARFVDKAALSFEAAMPFFGNKGIVTGNPVRKEFFDVRERPAKEPFNLLIFGGSQGARAINEAMIQALAILTDHHSGRLKITHQSGEANHDEVRARYAESGWQDADVRPYISNMVEAFDQADIIICRAGATTCAEVAAAGKAAIMVPFPGAADDHQRKNAEAMVENGAAKMILQADLSGERLAAEIMALIETPEQILAIGKAARSMSRPDAASVTVDLIESIANSSGIGQ